MSKPLDNLLKAVKTGDFVTANEAFGNIMQQKVSVLIANERRDIGKNLKEGREARFPEDKKCEMCGSTQRVKRVDDTWICKECDIEEAKEAQKCPRCGSDQPAGESCGCFDNDSQ